MSIGPAPATDRPNPSVTNTAEAPCRSIFPCRGFLFERAGCFMVSTLHSCTGTYCAPFAPHGRIAAYLLTHGQPDGVGFTHECLRKSLARNNFLQNKCEKYWLEAMYYGGINTSNRLFAAVMGLGMLGKVGKVGNFPGYGGDWIQKNRGLGSTAPPLRPVAETHKTNPFGLVQIDRFRGPQAPPPLSSPGSPPTCTP